jgi:hypothetical protein
MSGTADEEIIGLDVAVDQVFFMYSLHACYLKEHTEEKKIGHISKKYKGLPHLGAVKRKQQISPYHLFGQHGSGFDAEFPTAHIKQIFQAWTKHADYENIIQSFLAEIVSGRKSGYFGVSKEVKMAAVKTSFSPSNN